MFCLLVSFPTLFPIWCANKSYIIATSDLCLFIHASNLLPSLRTPPPYTHAHRHTVKVRDTHRPVHSVGVTQLGLDMGFCMVSPASPVSVSPACFPFILVLPVKSPVSDLVRLSVASRVHCSKSNFVFHEPLPTLCLY